MDKYHLSYLPAFEQDLRRAAMYISFVLENPEAVEKPVDSVEKAVLERLSAPESFQKYKSNMERHYLYYRIPDEKRKGNGSAPFSL